MAAPQVGLVGMAALRRDLKRMSEDTSGPLVEGLKRAGRVAAEPVAAATRAQLPRQSGALAGDVRVTAARTGAAVRMGRARLRYAGPVEFGGYPGDRQYMAAGRYMFPAAASLAEASARAYSAELERVLERSDLWTNTTTDPGAVHD